MNRLPVAILTPETASTVGPMRFYLRNGTTLKDISPRLGRTKLLDGSVHYDHRGLTDADRTIQLRTRITAAQTEALRGLMATGTRFFLAVKEAVWLGHIAKVNDTFGEVTIEYWPESRIGDASTIEYPDALVSFSPSLSALDGGSWTSLGSEDLTQIKIAPDVKSAVRWTSTIPAGATITSAYATLTSSWTQADAVNCVLSFHNVDDAAALPSGFYASEWGTETGQTVWGITATWPENDSFPTADIAGLLQTIIDRPGYVSGNAVMLFLVYYSPGSVGFRYAHSNPVLHVSYTP